MTELIIKEAISALEDFYNGNGKTRSMEYTYGFMDALSVLRGINDQFQISTSSVQSHVVSSK